MILVDSILYLPRGPGVNFLKQLFVLDRLPEDLSDLNTLGNSLDRFADVSGGKERHLNRWIDQVDLLITANLFSDRQAIERSHHQIKDHDIGLVIIQVLECRSPVRENMNVHAGVFRGYPDQINQVLVIIDEYRPCHFRSSSRSWSRRFFFSKL